MDKHKTVSKPPRKNVHENCKKKIKPQNTRNFTTWRGNERRREAQVLAISRHTSNDKITAQTQTNSNKRTTYMRDEEKREYLILFQSKRIQAPDARDHQAWDVLRYARDDWRKGTEKNEISNHRKLTISRLNQNRFSCISSSSCGGSPPPGHPPAAAKSCKSLSSSCSAFAVAPHNAISPDFFQLFAHGGGCAGMEGYDDGSTPGVANRFRVFPVFPGY